MHKHTQQASRRTEFVSIAGLRVDGRRAKEVRRVRCRLGLLQRVDGSAYYEQGNTKAIAVVYGPRQVGRRSQGKHDRAIINCEYRLVTSSRPQTVLHSRARVPTSVWHLSQAQNASGSALETGMIEPVGFYVPYTHVHSPSPLLSTSKSAEVSLAMKQTFETAIRTNLYKRSQIDIFVQILQADGGVGSIHCRKAVTFLVTHTFSVPSTLQGSWLHASTPPHLHSLTLVLPCKTLLWPVTLATWTALYC